MIRLDTVIMAHPKREAFIPELLATLDRPARVVWDRRNDRWDTGRRAWEAIDRTATHGLVLQDDAVVCRDLLAGVEAALAHVSDGSPLSLYAGRVRPFRELVEQLVNRAGDTAAWLTMAQIHWGVGIVLPTADIDDMITWCDQQTHVANYDKRISRWCQHRDRTVWYPWPSLVDHRDSPSLVPGRSHAGRHAHRFVGADTSALTRPWHGPAVAIPALNQPETLPPSRHIGGPPVQFVSLRYPNLNLSNKPGLHGIRFVDGVCEVTRPNAISILQSPWWQRRGVRIATDDDLRALAADRSPAAATVTEPTPPAVASPSPETDEQPPAGSAGDVLAWVGDDPQRARAALDAEQQRDKPRKGLVAKLATIAPAPVTVAPHSVTQHSSSTEV